MKKQIIGFILFTTIVGVSAFIYSLRRAEPICVLTSSIEKRPSPIRQIESPTEKNPETFAITQAVFDTTTNQINLELNLRQTANNRNSFPIALYFFVKEENGARLIESKKILVSPTFSKNGTARVEITNSFILLSEMKSKENLYVIAQALALNDEINTEKINPRFSENSATPVLLYTERRNPVAR